ncbi:MAG TPA: hypothetical protein VIL94_04310 [Acidothermaceae bacterium]
MTDDANPFGDISDIGSPDPAPPADSSPFGQPRGEPVAPQAQTRANQPPPVYGQQPNYGEQPKYGQYGAPPIRGTETNAVVALVLSIGSFLICPFVAAVVALFFASIARRNIVASGGAKDGLGMVTAAKVIAWVNIALSVVVLLLFAAGVAVLRAHTA